MAVFQIVSDLHLEFEEDYPSNSFQLPITNADAVILGGDTSRETRGIEWASKESVRHNKPFIYLLGNHEYYARSYEKVLGELQQAAKTLPGDIRILQNTTTVIAGVEIAGATLWTDFNLFGTPAYSGSIAQSRQGGLNDFKKIRKQNRSSRFTPIDTALAHQQSKNFLAEVLQRNPDAFVVTHHAPHPKSLPTDLTTREEEVSPAYASDLSSFINEYKPKHWFHGHIHRKTEYQIGDTHIFTNPRGYINISKPQETGFNPNLTISI